MCDVCVREYEEYLEKKKIQKDLDMDNTRCSSCRKKIEEDDAVFFNDFAYCDDCVHTCEDCKEECLKLYNAHTSLYIPINICGTCRDNDYYCCHDCNIYFHCDASHSEDNCGNTVCDSCSENYSECQSCNNIFTNDEISNNGYCYDCDTEENLDSLIHTYSFKPHPMFYPPITNGNLHYMGVELETESGYSDLTRNAEYVTDKLGEFVYLKEDGSLSNGFEIVTHPATLAKHKELWPALLDNKPDSLESFKWRQCGLHIHASRKHLSPLTVGKVLAFVNSKTNNKFLVTLAQRESTYSEFKDKKMTDVLPNNRIKNKYRDNARYEALNITGVDTIEFRLFKGNLEKDKLFRALEFVDAIIKFCERAKYSITDCISHTKFIQYVGANNKEYPELYKYCSNWSLNNKESHI